MLTPNGGVFGRNPKFNNVTVDGNLTVNGDIALGDDISIVDTLTVGGATALNGGMTVRPNAAAPTSNVTIGPSAGANLVADSVDNVLVGSGAGDVLGASGQNVAIGTSALGAFAAGAASITTTVAGSGGTPGNYDVTLEKDSGTGEFTTYPTVRVTVAAGGTVVANPSILTPGSGATVASGLIFRAVSYPAGLPTEWRGTLASVTGANVAIGFNASALNSANAVVSIGSGALDANTTGTGNLAVGTNALGANTTGTSNTAIGISSLLLNTTAGLNTAVGTQALQANTGSGNCGFGSTTLVNINGPYNFNVAIGNAAGRYRGTGVDGLFSTDNSIFIGAQSRAAGNGQTNQVVIGGFDAIGDGSNTTVLGTSATTQARIRGGTFLSSGANGQSTQLGQSTTLLTGLTGATVTATNLIPANCILLGVTARVTTAITGATTFDIGDGSTADRFGDDVAVALNTTANNCIAPSLITAATNVVLTANGSNFTAGAVRLTAHYMTLVAPTS